MTEDHTNKAGSPVIFKLSEDEKQLIAIIPAGTDVAPLNHIQLNKLINESGYANWHLLNDGLAKVCGLLGKAEIPTEIIIGERLDGELAIKVSDDASCVTMSITPPVGGMPVTVEQVTKALADSNITHGIKSDIIQQALSSNTTEKCVIAESTPPTHGEDSKFESLIVAAKDNRPQINKDGRADYHEIGSFVTVNAGDKLMRKMPPTNGTNGVDVYGKVIPAKPGKDIPFSNKLNGVEIDENDRSLLRSTTGGQPEVLENGMTVNPVINVKDVNLSTGNIDFDGTINIQGDVVEGMKIKATGDIIIAGMTEGAHIQAGGNIVIRKGVIGRGELRTETGEPGQSTAILTSGGSIEARFIENAIVHAAENITVGELVSHSELSAANKIHVGKKGAKKGHILGGSTRATMSIEAQIIGSQANVKTLIEVGNDPDLHEKSQQTISAYEEKIEEQKKLTTLIQRLKGQTDQKSESIMARAVSTFKKINEELVVITKEKAALEAQDQRTNSAIVQVRMHAFPGTSITICNANLVVRDRTEAGSFILDDKKVLFKHS